MKRVDNVTSFLSLTFIFRFKMLMYEALGLCDEGKGGELIDKAEWITNAEGEFFPLRFRFIPFSSYLQVEKF